MAVSTEAVLHLARSVVSCALLSACSFGSQVTRNSSAPYTSQGSVTDAVRWASVVTLLSAVYYLQFQFWRRIWVGKRERIVRSQYRQTAGQTRRDTIMEDIDLDRLDPAGEEWSEGPSVSNTVYYPELTMSCVWTHVYGWGVLLFVCIYCLAGVDVPSSCWWVMGMLALSFDELISKGAGKWLVCLLGLSLCGSVFAVWSGSLVDDDGNFVGDLLFTNTNDKGSVSVLNFIMGLAFPVSTPFIFFSIRSTVRGATRDVYKLCEFALPFMTVLAVCCLVATSGVCGGDLGNVGKLGVRRDLIGMSDRGLESHTMDSRPSLNATMTETVAKFAGSYHNNLDKHSTVSIDSIGMQYTLLLLSPIFAFWLIKVLVVDILTGHATEFITAFLFVTSARYGMTHAMGFWPVVALSGAGSAFVLLLLNLRD